MKTAKIKDLLKKEVLIIELPEDTQFDVLVDNPLWKDGIKFLTGTEEKFHFIEGSYTLLGKPGEIREEDAKAMVERIGEGDPSYQGDWFVNYQDDETMFETATESLLSALETVIFWENPLGKTPPIDMSTLGGSFGELYHEDYIKGIENWHEAELRTFDRSRTLIFVKQ